MGKAPAMSGRYPRYTGWQLRADRGIKFCPECPDGDNLPGKRLPVTSFNKGMNICRDCQRRRQEKRWGEKNTATRRYLRRKHRAPGYGYTTSEHIRLRWQMWGDRCYLCGAPAEATDHVIPLSRGGAHWPSNLRPICRSCNSAKKARSLAEVKHATR